MAEASGQQGNRDGFGNIYLVSWMDTNAGIVFFSIFMALNAYSGYGGYDNDKMQRVVMVLLVISTILLVSCTPGCGAVWSRKEFPYH